MKRSTLFLAFLAVLGTGLVFAQNSPETAAKQTLSLSNVKQLCLATIMYENDYDDAFPNTRTMKTFKYVTAPYLKSDKMWKDPNPAGGQYLFNMCLEGTVSTEVKEPASTPLVYESKAWADGRRAVGFTDGHAKFITEKDWKGYAPMLRLHLKKAKPIPR